MIVPVSSSRDMMLRINVTKKKMTKPTARKTRPIPEFEQDWGRNVLVPEIINTPNQQRSRNLVGPNGLIDSHETIDYDDPESFHCAIGSILAVAQCFGLLPVAGVRNPSPRNLLFKKCSSRTLYALLVIIVLMIVTVISTIHMVQTLNAGTFSINSGISAATTGVCFYGNNFVATVLFIWLAPRWASLQREWRAMERLLDRNTHRAPQLRWKFSMITGVVMSFALVEHILSIVNTTSPQMWSSTSNLTYHDFFQTYCEGSHGFIFSICPYNLGMGIFIFCFNKVATFTWNFMDLFIILVSTGLAERYKSLNQRLAGTIGPQECKNIDWREVREAYATLSSLVKRLDNDISPIVLLSFVNNLYFICTQLLNGLSPRESNILSSIYFFGSFAILIGRTIAVTLLAARINDQSKQALPVLYNCPGRHYNIETQRLLHQMTTDDVSLTGMRFFSITRNFMLAVAGVITTYELVLLQFNMAMHK